MGLYGYVIVMTQGLGQEIISQNKQKGYSEDEKAGIPKCQLDAYGVFILLQAF